MYQLKAMFPFDWRGAPVAVGDIITVETPQDEAYAEFLKQRGAVYSYHGPAPGEPPAHPEVPEQQPSETATAPMTTTDTAMTNVGRRSRS